MASLEISFPGGLQVDARVGDHRVRTDQPPKAGGDDEAPSPFDLFLASIGTCAGLYALSFCRRREIATEGLGLIVVTERNPETKHVDTLRLELRLPRGFPDKYRTAIVRAIDQCAVKRHVVDPPRFETVLSG